MSNKIPKIRLTGETSSPFEALYSLSRVVRESLRLHNVRSEKKRKLKKKMSNDMNLLQVGNAKRLRSKSMDNEIIEEEDVSDIGFSEIVASDYGSPMSIDKETSNNDDGVFETIKIKDKENSSVSTLNEKNKMIQLHKSRPDNHQRNSDWQVAQSDQFERQANKSQTSRQCSVPLTSFSSSSSVRRKSKDDSDVSSEADARSLRKRFSRLLVTLRANKFTLVESTESLSNIKEV